MTNECTECGTTVKQGLTVEEDGKIVCRLCHFLSIDNLKQED